MIFRVVGQHKKKKICMIAYTVYPFDARVRREAETLAASCSFEIIVLCLKQKATAQAYIKDKVYVQELNLIKYEGNRTAKYFISYARFLLKSFLACSYIFLQRGIDVVHVHNMPNALVLAAIIPKIFRKPLVLDMHDSVPDTFEAKFRGRTGVVLKILYLEEKLSAWMSNRIICVNHVQKNIAVRRGIPSEKIYISMNVPDHNRFVSLDDAKKVHIKDGRFKLVYHGTITERLGIDLAIEAVKLLRDRIPGIELHLWGGGDYVDFLRYQYQDSGSNEDIYFHEAVPIEELPRALAEVDVGIIPNRRSVATELMLPVKMMEYIALGIPVVAPKLRAIKHYFTDEMVSFFEPEDIESMAEAIFRVYHDASLYKTQMEKAKMFLVEYGWEKQSKCFIDFYHGILDRRKE